MNNILKRPERSYGVVINTSPPPKEQRDPAMWKKDLGVKEAKKSVDNSQAYFNHLITSYASNLKNMQANIHLTIGKQRL